MSERPDRSPFPGMDPYLERHWLDVHGSLVIYARDYLQPRLPPNLHARSEEHLALEWSDEEGEDRESRYPDVQVLEHGEAAGESAVAVATTTVAEPLVVPREEPASLRRYVAIVDPDNGGRLVTAIEFLSPTNKTSHGGRKQYAERQASLLGCGANLVEVDLTRKGEYVLAAPEELLPEAYREPYRISVVRATRPWGAEVYKVPLRERLPAFRIPLRPADRDVPLDLQELIDRAYVAGAYGRTIDYTRDPDPPLVPDDAAWANELLRAAGRR